MQKETGPAVPVTASIGGAPGHVTSHGPAGGGKGCGLGCRPVWAGGTEGFCARAGEVAINAAGFFLPGGLTPTWRIKDGEQTQKQTRSATVTVAERVW